MKLIWNFIIIIIDHHICPSLFFFFFHYFLFLFIIIILPPYYYSFIIIILLLCLSSFCCTSLFTLLSSPRPARTTRFFSVVLCLSPNFCRTSEMMASRPRSMTISTLPTHDVAIDALLSLTNQQRPIDPSRSSASSSTVLCTPEVEHEDPSSEYGAFKVSKQELEEIQAFVSHWDRRIETLFLKGFLKEAAVVATPLQPDRQPKVHWYCRQGLAESE